MKNFSISKKLVIGFSTVLGLMIITVAIALFGIGGINKQIHSYAKYTLPNTAP